MNTRQCWIHSAYCERVAVLLEGCDGCVWVMDVHCEASALCVGQPQQQGVQGFMELLYGGKRLVLNDAKQNWQIIDSAILQLYTKSV